MTEMELKASVLRGCATSGRTWAAMAINDPTMPEVALEDELDAVLMSLVGDLRLRRDGLFCRIAKDVIVQNLAHELKAAREQGVITIH